jgi:hypothetical protein
MILQVTLPAQHGLRAEASKEPTDLVIAAVALWGGELTSPQSLPILQLTTQPFGTGTPYTLQTRNQSSYSMLGC